MADEKDELTLPIFGRYAHAKGRFAICALLLIVLWALYALKQIATGADWDAFARLVELCAWCRDWLQETELPQSRDEAP